MPPNQSSGPISAAASRAGPVPARSASCHAAASSAWPAASRARAISGAAAASSAVGEYLERGRRDRRREDRLDAARLRDAHATANPFGPRRIRGLGGEVAEHRRAATRPALALGEGEGLGDLARRERRLA